jgi:hypothetical protein
MNSRLVIGALALVVSVGCGSSSQNATETKPQTKPAESAASSSAGQPAAGAGGQGQVAQGQQQVSQGLQQMAQGLQQMAKSSAKAVDSDELKALLPDISGWTKSDVKGEMVSMGISQSNARATYTKGDSTIELEITDSTMNQLILAPLAMFMASGFEEKSDDGYKKATPVGGFPGFEEWEKESKHGQATAVVANRFIVTANSHGVDSPDMARKAVEAVNLSKLSGLK